MDPMGNIYESDDVPAEDKARLEGYLKARAEADADKHADLLAEMEAKVRALEAEQDR